TGNDYTFCHAVNPNLINYRVLIIVIFYKFILGDNKNDVKRRINTKLNLYSA
ncbi:MAG: hypothetical protein ACI910_003172, partial [Oleispira sp.]